MTSKWRQIRHVFANTLRLRAQSPDILIQLSGDCFLFMRSCRMRLRSRPLYSRRAENVIAQWLRSFAGIAHKQQHVLLFFCEKRLDFFVICWTFLYLHFEILDIFFIRGKILIKVYSLHWFYSYTLCKCNWSAKCAELKISRCTCLTIITRIS